MGAFITIRPPKKRRITGQFADYSPQDTDELPARLKQPRPKKKAKDKD